MKEKEEKSFDNLIPTTDDPSTPAFTPRMLILGLFWCCFLSVVNAVGNWRTTRIQVDTMFACLLSYPMGILLAKILPNYSFFGIHLNPGPFSIKEHVLVSVMANVGSHGTVAIDNVVVQKFHLYIGDPNVTFYGSVLWVLTLQLIGFGLAGLTTRFLVTPRNLIYPSILSKVALYIALHSRESPIGKWKMGRYKFFWISFTIFFIYTFIPQYFLQSLQAIAVLCLFSRNRVANFLGSVERNQGVGLLAITFDWNYIHASSLTIPFIYMVNKTFGGVMYDWIITPLLFFNNAFNSPKLVLNNPYPDGSYRPGLNSQALFSNNGSRINIINLYNKNTFTLNKTVYDSIKPIYITEQFAMQYLSHFLTLSSMVSFVALWHGRRIYTQFKDAINQTVDQDDDIHSKLMAKYSTIPEKLWLIYLVIVLVLISLVVTFTQFTMPIWGVCVAFLVSVLTVFPSGIILGIFM